MEIVLNRRGGVPVRDQLVTQIELKILGGGLRAGQRLPSVRALARQLRLHPNTVSAAYQDLQAAGHVRLRRGAGVYVLETGPTQLQDARGLDEMVRMALRVALTRGFAVSEIRAAAERWLAAAPPDRVVVVDPVPEMADLLVAELARSLPARVSACRPESLTADDVSGALVLALPYHVEALRRKYPSAACEPVTLEVSEADRDLILSLPEGGIVLVVSHSPTVLPFARVLLRSLRGDEIHVETHHIAQSSAWRRLCRAADLVCADVLALPKVSRARPRRLREFCLVSAQAIAHLRDALAFVVPR